MIRRVLLALVLIVPLGQVHADDPPKATVSWDPAKPDIGDTVMLTVEITVGESRLVTFPALDEDARGFAVTGRLPAEPEQAATGTRLWRQVYRLELETTGTITLPDIHIVVHDPATMEETRATVSGVAIPVVSRTAGIDDLRQIRGPLGPVELQASARDRTPWIIGGVTAVLVLGALGLWLLRRRPDAVMAPGESARDAALRALGDLDSAANERFHAELADVLRRFLDRGFGIGAPRQTTSEAVAALHAREVDPGQVGPALAQCDRVKFARAVPDREARDRVLAAATSFVQSSGAA